MVPAVVTEKETARKAFESEVREKRAGPAIIEQVTGNIFKTRLKKNTRKNSHPVFLAHIRIYPIPANGTRTIQVTYKEQLTFATSNTEMTYNLPLELVSHPTFQLSFCIETAPDCGKPQWVSTDELPTLDFIQDKNKPRIFNAHVFADNKRYPRIPAPQFSHHHKFNFLFNWF